MRALIILFSLFASLAVCALAAGMLQQLGASTLVQCVVGFGIPSAIAAAVWWFTGDY